VGFPHAEPIANSERGSGTLSAAILFTLTRQTIALCLRCGQMSVGPKAGRPSPIICNNRAMKRPFAATVWREGNWYVSQCLEVDVASQGETEQEALANLKEALELHFEPPQATRPPMPCTVEVEVGAA